MIKKIAGFFPSVSNLFALKIQINKVLYSHSFSKEEFGLVILAGNFNFEFLQNVLLKNVEEHDSSLSFLNLGRKKVR